MRFTDGEWKAIIECFPTSSDLQQRQQSMRDDVEAHLNFFLRYKQSYSTSLNTKRSINKVRNYAIKLRKELDFLANDTVYQVAGLPMGKIGNTDFDLLIKKLGWLQFDMESAASRVSMRPSRKPTGPTDFLITHLNWIQGDVTGEPVIRSNKRTERANANNFVKLCCKKVGLSQDQIDRSLKRVISKFHSALALGVDISSNPFGEPREKFASKRARPKSKK